MSTKMVPKWGSWFWWCSCAGMMVGMFGMFVFMFFVIVLAGISSSFPSFPVQSIGLESEKFANDYDDYGDIWGFGEFDDSGESEGLTMEKYNRVYIGQSCLLASLELLPAEPAEVTSFGGEATMSTTYKFEDEIDFKVVVITVMDGEVIGKSQMGLD